MSSAELRPDAPLVLPAQCGTAAAEGLKGALLQAAGSGAIRIDASQVGSLGQSVVQLLLDRTFIRRMAEEERARTLVCSMVSLSHDLGYRVVAEGVETADALQLLGAMGCDEAQGYHLARPMELDAFERWLRSYPPSADGRVAAA